jgi:hypothetical protein
MIDTRILREFVTNPFPDEKKARELLSAIDNRQISDLEFARGLFCFQIAFYFLAWLAVTEQIDDTSLQKSSIGKLHDQIRAFYANASSKVKFSDFVVSQAERGNFIAALRQQLNEPTGTRIDTSALTTSKLTLFDLVGVPRLWDYHDAMGQPNRHKFYVVAERVLFHYGAKKYQSASVMALTNLLLDSYSVAAKIVTSVPHSRSEVHDEGSDSSEPIPQPKQRSWWKW